MPRLDETGDCCGKQGECAIKDWQGVNRLRNAMIRAMIVLDSRIKDEEKPKP